MKKQRIIGSIIISIVLLLLAGGAKMEHIVVAETDNEEETEQVTNVSKTESGEASLDDQTEVTGTTATVQGPYGSISITVPDGWSYLTCNVGDENLLSAEYGIQFFPNRADGGYIEVGYHSAFGVCGTGLEEKEATLAQNPVRIGYYDGRSMWDFVCFQGEYDGIVALATENEDWDEQEQNETMEILDSVVFCTEEQSGAIGIYDRDSESDAFALMISAENVSQTGASFVFHQYDKEVVTELFFGENMTIEKKSESGWEKVTPVTQDEYVEGVASFVEDAQYKDVAHIIEPESTTKYQYDWEPFYGSLDAGEYRIAVPVRNKRKTGVYDCEIIYAHFLIR
jgi:hypothetical protein